jgi:hypothetical protein
MTTVAEPFNIVFAVQYCLAFVVLWSEFLATDPEVQVRFPALSDFLSSSRSGTCPLSLVIKIEGLLERKISGSGLENRDYGRKGSAALTTWHPSTRKRWLTSATSGGLSVGIVRSQTKAIELLLLVLDILYFSILLHSFNTEYMFFWPSM